METSVAFNITLDEFIDMVTDAAESAVNDNFSEERAEKIGERVCTYTETVLQRLVAGENTSSAYIDGLYKQATETRDTEYFAAFYTALLSNAMVTALVEYYKVPKNLQERTIRSFTLELLNGILKSAPSNIRQVLEMAIRRGFPHGDSLADEIFGVDSTI